MKQLLRLAVGAALATIIVSPALAQRPGGGRQPGGAGLAMWSLLDSDLNRIAKTLTLTDDQLLEIGVLMAGIHEEHGEALERQAKMREEMRSLFSSGQRPAREDMQKITEKYGNPQRELQPVMEGFEQELNEILTDEQKSKFSTEVQNSFGRRRPG